MGVYMISKLFSLPSPRVSTMASTSQQQSGRDGALSALDAPIQVLTLAKDTCGVRPAQVALGSAVALLTMIRVRFLPFYNGGILTLVYPGPNDKGTGLR